jgi:acetyl esterase/lipase
LAVAVMMYLRDEGYKLPGAAILMCPWVGAFFFSRLLSIILRVGVRR